MTERLLILVKHSLPEVLENAPACEWHLSQEGRYRAERLAERLSSYRPRLLVSSTEPKAEETAEIIAGRLKLTRHLVGDLHEHDRSQTGYLSQIEFERSVREFFASPDALVFGSETANAAHERFSKAVDQILSMHPEGTTVIVAHGTVISLFVANRIGISCFALWNELGLPSFVVLGLESGELIAKENIL
jgi:broad specificity phosphatase PhoE